MNIQVKNSAPVTRQESDRKLSNTKTDTKKVQKTGHESCLAKAIYERRSVQIHLLNGGTFTGELLEFDTYSLRVRIDGGDCMWIFKSAMMGFKEVESNVGNSQV